MAIKTLKGLILTFLFIIFPFTSIYSQRERKTINDGWKFYNGDVVEAEKQNYNDCNWEAVHLPHTWNNDAYIDKDYYQGPGWYRKILNIPENWLNENVMLTFEGASKSLTLFIDGKEIGKHKGGYTSYSIDLTPYLKDKSQHLLAVKVDNADESVPPVSADFTFFGGIYRDVWIEKIPRVHFKKDNYGGKGIRINTPLVTDSLGVISVNANVKRDSLVAEDLGLQIKLYDPSGKLIQTFRGKGENSKDKIKFTALSDTIYNPVLWTPESPSLYSIECEVIDSKNGKVLDREKEVVAFRYFSFDPDSGFYLNGNPYKLRGVCRHQDQKPIGPALTDEMHRRDFKLMKDMGVNFLRIAHYPQDEALLEMCDREGMLVWEEIPVIDYLPDNEAYSENAEINLKEMISQHYNHPSIILWGYMNEILLRVNQQYPDKKEQEETISRTLDLANRLEKIIDEEDPNRFSTIAFHGSDQYNTVGLGDITDIVGWNLYSGWYSNDLEDFENFVDARHKEHPSQSMIISEYGAGSDKRLHSFLPEKFDFSIEYQQLFAEHYLHEIEKRPFIAGSTYWNFIDFSSAKREESMPRINNKGLVYSDRKPKDVYYYFQSAWRNDIPVLHIASGDWQKRVVVTDDVNSFMHPVKIYSNLPQIELFLNGESQGIKDLQNYNTVFYLNLKEGKNALVARGNYKNSDIYDVLEINSLTLPENTANYDLGINEFAVNVGSNTFYTSEDTGLTWVPDREYKPGSWGALKGEMKNVPNEIFLTSDDPLFQSFRENIEGYRFDMPYGNYEVELLFSENNGDKETLAYLLEFENNVPDIFSSFNILINDELKEEAFSPVTDHGSFNAIRKKYEVKNDKGYVEVKFNPLNGKPSLSGIKIRKL